MRKFLRRHSFERVVRGRSRAPGDTQDTKDIQGMGDVIRLAERRAALRDARGASTRDAPRRVSAPARAELFFDLRCPFSYLAAERVERVFDDIVWTPASTTALRCGSLAADAERLERVRRAAERRALRAAAAARVARALPRRRSRRHARGVVRLPSRAAAPRSRSRPAGSRSAAASTSTIPRSSPRRPPPPASGSTAACRRSASCAATARSRRPGAGCCRRARTGCPRCGSGARCSGARTGSPRLRPRRGCEPRRAPRAEAAAGGASRG